MTQDKVIEAANKANLCDKQGFAISKDGNPMLKAVAKFAELIQAQPTPSQDEVKIPTSIDEAKLMAIISTNYLKQFAPNELKQPTPSQSEQVATDAPKKIYLQLSDEPISYQQAMQDGDVSWCADKVFECDIEYQLVEPSQSEPVASNSYIQPVPDHCDRIIWRNNYYSIALLTPQPTSQDVLEYVERLEETLKDAINLRVKLFRGGDFDGDTDKLPDNEIINRESYARKWQKALDSRPDAAMKEGK